MSEINNLVKNITDFRAARDWDKTHTLKDLAISLCLESSEVLEHFQWKSKSEIEDHAIKFKENIGEELADVFWYLVLLSQDLNIDLSKAVIRKLNINEKRYPVKKFKGQHSSK